MVLKHLNFFNVTLFILIATVPPLCGTECNKTITIDAATASGVFQWQSEGWGISDYPEDCTCMLNVEVRRSFE